MKIQPQRHPELARLAERLEPLRVAMLTLRNSRGQLDARPLTPLEMDADGAVWMMVSRQAMRPLFALDAQQANLAFCDASSNVDVSISGPARLVDDPARKEQLWTAMARPWFSGADDPDLTLLCLQTEDAEVWDGPSSSVVRVLALAASVAAGAPIGLGGHEHLVPPMPLPHPQTA